eukprot:TRINITY_DN19581_c0_g2_i1.p1 TRINITY_DN19581_c0_g2~~TRINITY_DN19581_c0_g2_i1.p1  ORF type:complete len:116 (+),score=19.30 TRINITY_DN19581_c0_g2_i1:32-349(+)
MAFVAKRVGGTVVMHFMLLQAILTVVGGHVFLGEVLRASQLFGGVLILIGIRVFVLAIAHADVESKREIELPTTGDAQEFLVLGSSMDPLEGRVVATNTFEAGDG